MTDDAEGGRGGFRRALPPKEADTAAELELEHHLAERIDQLVQAGMDPARARAEAERSFGDPRRYRARMVRSASRKRRGDLLLRASRVLTAGVSDTLRTIGRHPGFAWSVIGTLALGIGANAVMFGILDRLMLQPPEHIQNPELIRRVVVTNPGGLTYWAGGEDRDVRLAYPDILDLRAHSAVAGVGAYNAVGESTLGSGADAVRIRTAQASHELLPLLGVRPTVGRFFAADEDRPGAPDVIVLGYEFWRRAFAESPAIVGRTIQIDGRSTTVIGVTPPRFTGVDLAPVDAWLPLGGRMLEYCFETRNCRAASAIVRLPPGTDVAAWESEATALHRTSRAGAIRSGLYDARAGIVLDPLMAARGPDAPNEARVSLWLAGVSLFVLVIACANVANLLLVRGLRARRDVAVHYVLGLDQGSLVARRVVESVLLAVVGGVLGLALATWGGAVVRRVLLPDVEFFGSGIDGRVLAFSVLAALLAGGAAGVGPALQSAKSQLGDHLRRRGETGPGSSARIRTLLTGGQIALSALLLIGAALFIRSLAETRRLDLGVDVDQIVKVVPELVSEGPGHEQVFERALTSLLGLPGVLGVSTEGARGAVFVIRTEEGDSMPLLAGGGPFTNVVSPGHLTNLGLRLLHGRELSEQDGPGDPPVTILSETMAHALWPDEDALGKCIRRDGPHPCMTVVGVVEDAHSQLERPPRMDFYVTHAQHAAALGLRNGDARTSWDPQQIYVRVERDPLGMVPLITDNLRALDPAIRYVSVRTLRDELGPQVRSWTLGASLFTIFGVLALAVASLGLYSLLAFEVAQRTRELGIRAALGAEKRRLLLSVVARGVLTGALGVVMGTAIAWVAAPYAEDLLFQVSPRDPAVISGVAASLFGVAVLASLIPGLRATRADPMVALRSE